MSNKTAEQRVLCERILTLAGQNVVVRLREPAIVPSDYWGDYLCAFEIDGLAEPIRGGGRGIDSLAALVSANTHAAYALFPYRNDLKWDDGSYDVFIDYCVRLADAGRRRRVREIIDEEDFRLAQDQIDSELIRRAKGGIPLPSVTQVDEAPINAPKSDGEAHAALSKLPAALCERHLKLDTTAEVTVRIWRPTRVEGYGAADHQTMFQVVGLQDDEPMTTLGGDSMQALLLAVHAIDSYLNPWREKLTWLGLAYEDPAFSRVLDAGRRRRIHEIIEEEIYAIAAIAKMRHERREAEARLCADGALT